MSIKFLRNKSTFHSQLINTNEENGTTNYDNKMVDMMLQEEFDTIELSEHGNKQNSQSSIFRSPNNTNHNNNNSTSTTTPRTKNSNSFYSSSKNQVRDEYDEEIIKIKLFGHHPLINQQDGSDGNNNNNNNNEDIDRHIMRPIFYLSSASSGRSSSSSTTNCCATWCNFTFVVTKFLCCNFCSTCRRKHSFERIEE